MKKPSFVAISLLTLFLLGMGWFYQPLPQQENETTLNAYQQGSESWLVLAKKLAPTNGSVAFKLAHYFKDNDDLTQSILWFNQAIRLEHNSSHLALASLYFENDNFTLAKQVLDSTNITADHELLILSIKLAVEIGDVKYIQEHITQLQSVDAGKTLVKALKHYQVIATDDFETLSNESIVSCENPVQFIATNFIDLARSEALIQAFKSHELSYYFCFFPPRYKSIETLQCNVVSSEKAITCDESIWAEETLTENTRYLAVLLKQGGANVHKGILYLDRHDTVDVLLHELTHFLGFIDEYELPVNHNACSQIQSQTWAHNIAVLPELYQGEKEAIRESILNQLPWGNAIHPDTPILGYSDKGWVLGTPEKYSDSVGVFLSDTCNKSSHQAYKPLGFATTLTYNEIDFPKVYADLLKEKPNDYRMPSYHFNVAQALWLKGKEQEAKHWFTRLLP